MKKSGVELLKLSRDAQMRLANLAIEVEIAHKKRYSAYRTSDDAINLLNYASQSVNESVVRALDKFYELISSDGLMLLARLGVKKLQRELVWN